MDPGSVICNFDGLLLLKCLGNLQEMLTDYNVASLINLEHSIIHKNFLNSQEPMKVKNPEAQVSLVSMVKIPVSVL